MLRRAGMNIVRMNFSHGSYEYHGEVIDNARASVAAEPLDGRLLAIALDTKGPEIRTGMTAGGDGVMLEKGARLLVTTDASQKDACSASQIYMDYANLPKVMSVGGVIFVDDGLIALKVAAIDAAAGTLECEVVNSGLLGSKKGCNLPEVDVDLPALSAKDRDDLAFAVSKDVDMVFASFIRKASDVHEVRACLVAADPVVGKRIRIISKIENHEGMRNFDEILAATDGVMVARGDLGIEIPSEKVFLAQKMMIAKCNVAGKPCICATQMLESMTSNPRPTRAEASDVANAVLDGADCVMLSGETAKGAYPREAVAMMDLVCKEAEAAIFIRRETEQMTLTMPKPLSMNESVAKAVVDAAHSHAARLILTLTTTGTSARLISKYRPTCPIMTVCRDSHIGSSLHLHRGTLPFHYPEPKPESGDDIEKRIDFGIELAFANGFCKKGDPIVVAWGWRSGVASLTSFRMIKVGVRETAKGLVSVVPKELEELCSFAMPQRGALVAPEGLESPTGHAGRQNAAQDAATTYGHRCKLDIYSQPSRLRATGIICTIGPKTKAVEQLTMLRRAGMNIVRMNFSHGSYEYHGEVIDNARASVAAEPLDGRLLAIALDTKGPEIRTGMTAGGDGVMLEKGARLLVTTDASQKDACSASQIYMDYANLPKVMSVGGVIFVDDGLIALKVAAIDAAAGTLECEVVNSGLLGSKKGCNLPEVDVDLPALSAKDRDDLAFAVSKDVDMVFASFIRKASDVHEVRACLVAADPVVGKRIRIISKIENHEGMRNFDEILAATDGVMVARGDLGIEIPSEKVFLAQKMMIAKCNVAGKPCICATQMLESMTSNPRPTRAEASDVANAVLDGADCVMLSGETAKGAYPREAVAMMDLVCKEAEAAIYYKELAADLDLLREYPLLTSEAVADAVVEAADLNGASLILTLTSSGNSPRLISQSRPRCPIMVLASEAHVGAALNLHRGCIPFHYPHPREESDEDRRFAYGLKLARSVGLVQSGDTVLLAHGAKTGTSSLASFRIIMVA